MKLVKLLFLCVLFFSTHRPCYAGDVASSINHQKFHSSPWKPTTYKHYPHEKKPVAPERTTLINTGRKKTHTVKRVADGQDYSAKKEWTDTVGLPWKPADYTHSQSKIWSYDFARNVEAINLDTRIKKILTHPTLSDETKIALLTLLAWKSPLKTEAFDVLTSPIIKADGTRCFNFYIRKQDNRPIHFPVLTLLANGKQVPSFNENDIVWPNELCTSLSEVKELIDPILTEITEAREGTYLTRHMLK